MKGRRREGRKDGRKGEREKRRENVGSGNDKTNKSNLDGETAKN